MAQLPARYLRIGINGKTRGSLFGASPGRLPAYLLAITLLAMPLMLPTRTVATESITQHPSAAQLLEQGLQAEQRSQTRAAIAAWEQALVLYRQSGDRRGEGKVLVYLGRAYFLLGQDERAITALQTSLTLAQQFNDPLGEATALTEMGTVHYFLGNYAQALVYHQQAWVIAQRLQDRPRQIVALRNLGMANDALGNYQKAVEYHRQGVAIARQIQDHPSESLALRHLGLAYYFLGNYPATITTHKQALSLARKFGDRSGEGWLLGNLGIAYYYLGDYARAIDYQQQRLAIARELKDGQAEGTTLNGLGTAHYQLGDYSRAIAYFQQSLDLARPVNDLQSVGAALANLGNVHFSLGEYDQAIALYQQGLTIARTSQHPQSQSVILGNLGRTFLTLGNYPQAIVHHWQALAIARQIKDRQSEGVALGNLGGAYLAAGKPNQAITYAQQWLAIARQVKDRQGEGSALIDLGAAYQAIGSLPQALAAYRESLAIARAIGSKRGEGLALDRLGDTLFRTGDLATAEQTLRAAIAVWESLRSRLDDPTAPPSKVPHSIQPTVDTHKVSLFELQASTYQLLQQVLVAQQKTDAALEIAERGRARAFVELLSQRLTLPSQGTAPANQPDPVPPVTIAQIQAIAQAQNATLVTYSLINDASAATLSFPSLQETHLYIWVIQPTGAIAFRQVDVRSSQPDPTSPSPEPVPVAPVTDLVAQTRNTMRGLGVVPTHQSERTATPLRFQPEPDQVSRQLRQLHQLLIAPIANQLPKDASQRVIFIPQGALFLVPFAALRDGNQYLIERHSILTAPSIQVLAQTRQLQSAHRPVPPSPALVVGNPMPMPRSLAPLPYAVDEAETVAKALQTRALIGPQATKQAVLTQMPTAGWIHFATHAIFDSHRGLGSAIALAPDSGTGSPNLASSEDGFLTAEHISTMNLNARVVVLSACNTGRGRITADGVIGLARSLISAGIPSVVVSLWAVPDAPTAFLMGEFYRQLAQNPDKAQALRQAMLTTKRQYPKPLDWAAFTLIGEAL